MISKRAFLSLEDLQCILMASFPGLGPSVQHTPLTIDSWHSAAPYSREKVLGFNVALTADLPRSVRALERPTAFPAVYHHEDINIF